MRKNTIFDNYNSDDYREGAVENLLINEIYESEEEIPDSAIWEEIWELQSLYWEDARAEMENFFEGKTLLIRGTFGSWRGALPAGKVITYDELWKAWKDCDYISIYDEDGKFFIKASHHDGTNYYEVRILTEKGAEIYDRWEYGVSRWENLNEREVHEKLWENSHYTHIPHFAREVYGCRTR